MDAHVEFTPLPNELSRILDIAPLENYSQSVWLILTDDGGITLFNADSAECTHLTTLALHAEPAHEPWMDHVLKHRLHASADGRFAAVVNDYGSYGEIVDLDSGAITKRLGGGTEHSETVPFSFTFAVLQGRTVAIYRTDWNRLDISDAATGKLLTDRGPTGYMQGEERPEHYLDYFHGALRLSPGGVRIVDDGWVWHPVGVVVTWDLEAWASNRWESEDGPTMKAVCLREYYWDHGMVWLSDRILAVSGLGEGDTRIFDVTQTAVAGDASMFCVEQALELHAFPGPAGHFFSDGTALFSSNAKGLSRWNPSNGSLTGYVPDFHPTHHHRHAGELVEVQGGVFLRWKIEQPSSD